MTRNENGTWALTDKEMAKISWLLDELEGFQEKLTLTTNREAFKNYANEDVIEAKTLSEKIFNTLDEAGYFAEYEAEPVE